MPDLVTTVRRLPPGAQFAISSSGVVCGGVATYALWFDHSQGLEAPLLFLGFGILWLAHLGVFAMSWRGSGAQLIQALRGANAGPPTAQAQPQAALARIAICLELAIVGGLATFGLWEEWVAVASAGIYAAWRSLLARRRGMFPALVLPYFFATRLLAGLLLVGVGYVSALVLHLAPVTPVEALSTASSDGDVAKVRAELADGVSPNALDSRGISPLSRAAENCQVGVVKVLLAAHADPNLLDGKDALLRETPLLSAFSAQRVNGCPDVVSALVAGGANVNAADGDGVMTPLGQAAADGDVESAKLLIAAGANVNGGTVTPLQQTQGKPMGAVSPANVAAVAALLRAHGAHI